MGREIHREIGAWIARARTAEAIMQMPVAQGVFIGEIDDGCRWELP